MSTMGRSRGGRFADRPDNVEINTIGNVTYFRYVMPDGQRRPIGNSRDTDKAYDLARALNGHFAAQRTKLDVAALTAPRGRRASASNPLIPTLIDEFRTHDPKRKGYAERTRAELDFKLNAYAKLWQDRTVGDMRTLDFSQFLNTLTDNAYVKHRAALFNLMQFAGHQGYIEVNPVAVTLIKRESKKVRERHTWEGVRQILDFKGVPATEQSPEIPPTPEWLKRAIRIGLYSLQRADDVVRLHKTRNKVDLKAGTFEVLQRKTRNYRHPVYIEIEMGAELLEAVRDCLQSDVLCPLLIHRKPARAKPRDRDPKEHPFAVTRDTLSRAFSEARDNAHAYDHLEPERRPTFHELRSLGVHLYQRAGYDDDYIMALSGHAKKETLERYKRDHVAPKPRRVKAGLTSKQLPR